ncbi:MAG: hypothetical protein IPN14_08330 [Bacteroidetes bacterium]|nr:hypothetical protein [Bacteroidota bacterium]
MLKKLGLQYKDGKIIVSLPFTHKKFITIVNYLPFSYSEIRKNYSDTNSTPLNDFIFPEFYEELKIAYYSLLKKGLLMKIVMLKSILQLSRVLKNHKSQIPKELKDLCWGFVKMLDHLPGKQKTLKSWEENLGTTKVNLEKVN